MQSGLPKQRSLDHDGDRPFAEECVQMRTPLSARPLLSASGLHRKWPSLGVAEKARIGRDLFRSEDDPPVSKPATPLLSLRWTFRAKGACVVSTDAEPVRRALLTPPAPGGGGALLRHMSKRKPARTIKARCASKIRSKAAGSGQPTGQPNSKQALVLALLCGPSGATIATITRDKVAASKRKVV
jgi:hypothetical protein